MAQKSNAPDLETLPVEPEEPKEQTETQPEGEPQPVEKTETEPPAGSKSWEQALQKRQELLKEEKAQRESLALELDETRKKLEELELQGLGETERYKVEAERAKREAETLKEQLEVNRIKEEYRRILVEKESEHPKTVAFLRRQMDKNIYPVQGQSMSEVEQNLDEFASEFESTPQGTTPTASNPAYTPPAEVDLSKLSAAEMGKLLPHKEED